MKKIILLICITAILTSCQSFKEVHYFKDKAGMPPNYYKLRVKGHAFLTSSRYLSGYFDEHAVDDYFSEIVQPKNAKFSSPQTAESIDARNKGKKFVMLLSTNSEAIASQIGNFVQTQSTLDALAKVMNRDKIEAYNTKKVESAKLENEYQEVLFLGDQYIKGLSSASTQAQAEANLLAMVNRLVKKYGHADFADLPAAAAWFTANRALLLNAN